MSFGRLWAGWRGEYVSGALDAEPSGDEATPLPGGGCVLCRVTRLGADPSEDGILWRGEFCAAVLNAYPYGSGHLMVLPLRHVADLEDLDSHEASELWRAVTDAVTALKLAYRPGGINVGINLGRAAGAGVPGHLHVHALPRWDGDTNFMTAVAEVRVLPENLSASAAKLRAAWPRGPGPVSGDTLASS